jgi:ubiquinol-cytochrome c reductase cytochrome c1 subunit
MITVNRTQFFLLLIAFTMPQTLLASSAVHLDQANIDPHDKASIIRGAQNFVDYCFGCHSLSFMRYNRIGKDLGLSEDEVSEKLLFTGAKVGDLMKNAIRGEDAARWFGTKPPDLSVVVRSRSVDWIYTYLRSFYKDDSRPWGVNNKVFKDVAMPHVLWELQGLQELKSAESGHDKQLVLAQKGKLSPEQFDAWVRDTVNFLNYASEPTKQKRLAVGKWVIGFLLLFWLVMYLLKNEYWKDVKR